MAPWRTIAGAYINQPCFGIVNNRVPRVAASADFPPVAGPCCRSKFHVGIFEAVSGIAGYHPETPGFRSCVGIIGSHVTARTEFGTAIADDDLAIGDTRSASDR